MVVLLTPLVVVLGLEYSYIAVPVVKSLVVPVKTFIPVVDVWKASHCISAASSMEIALKQYSFSGCQGLTRLWANVSLQSSKNQL